MMRILQPGLLTTIQDLGRYGYQKFGVIPSGAMDTYALTVANGLVGNPADAPAMEMTLLGPTIAFETDTLVAVTGFGGQPKMEGREVPTWRPVLVTAGSVIRFSPEPVGCRMYLSAAGGFDVPLVLGSSSTYLRGAIGGYKGRPLQMGDELKTHEPAATARHLAKRLGEHLDGSKFAYPKWFVGSNAMPAYGQKHRIRVLPGAQYDAFTDEARENFLNHPFTVTPNSDRMGYRLQGPKLESTAPLELLSEVVAFGTIQVPGDGNPIILMADHQTTGGYAKIGQVITVDLPVLAQVRPGETIRFELTTLQEAHRLLGLQRRTLAMMQVGISGLERQR